MPAEASTIGHLDPASAAISPGLPDSQTLTPSSQSSRVPDGSAGSDVLLKAASPSLSFTHIPPLVPITTDECNHAPGIPDRRKSVRPSGSRGKLKTGRRSVTPRGVNSMADMGNEMKVNGGEVETPGESGV